MSADLFGPKPRRKARRLMHVSDAGDCCTAEGGDAVIVQFKCVRCGHETDWMEVATATEAKRGIPCPRCNEEEKGKCNEASKARLRPAPLF